MNLNYYQILEINTSADLPTIKKAYRKLAFSFHPDKSNNPQKSKHFLLIQEAYQTLSDPVLKRVYDKKLAFNTSIGATTTKNISTKDQLIHIQKYADAVVIQKKYSMSEPLKRDFLMDVLEDHKMEYFLAKATDEEIEDLYYHIFLITEQLSKKYRTEVFHQLQKVFGNNPKIEKAVKDCNRKLRLNDWYQQYQAYILILIGIVLCYFMYLYATSFRK
ncbi:MAG TPA: DnaJ domain-containing protein [Edaphocola sp.]|nr:DnaJ domain-containing protein [Edaphocola sp.]